MSEAPRRRVFSQIGGHPALDLINTVEWRLSPARFEEDLHDYVDVLRWAHQLGLVDEMRTERLTAQARRRSNEAQAETERVIRLREAIYALLFQAADPAPVLAEYREAVAHGELGRAETAWGWELPVDLALPRRRIALAAFDLMTRTDLSLLAQCDDAECGWVFLDTSPRHNRRWCVSADCGNRNRVREYYQRSRAGAATEG